MKLNYAPQAGLRRRKPDQHRETMAFWAGIAILCLFELVLMSKSWSSESAAHIFDFHVEQAQAADADQGDAAPAN
ncbi:MAG TPA: hypothetical protein VGM25_04595 [Caulobacteraceae bacterium]|jgi:hypothetical protein